MSKEPSKKSASKSPKKKVARKSVKKVKATAQKSRQKILDYKEESEQTLKQIWLAGLGAYGMSLDNIQEKAGKLAQERKELFDLLVDRGEQMQDETNSALSQKVEEVEGRIEKIKQQLSEGYSSSPLAQRVDQVVSKLDKLNEKKRR